MYTIPLPLLPSLSHRPRTLVPTTILIALTFLDNFVYSFWKKTQKIRTTLITHRCDSRFEPPPPTASSQSIIFPASDKHRQMASFNRREVSPTSFVNYQWSSFRLNAPMWIEWGEMIVATMIFSLFCSDDKNRHRRCILARAWIRSRLWESPCKALVF